jgi:hypothetical protein
MCMGGAGGHHGGGEVHGFVMAVEVVHILHGEK